MYLCILLQIQCFQDCNDLVWSDMCPPLRFTYTVSFPLLTIKKTTFTSFRTYIFSLFWSTSSLYEQLIIMSYLHKKKCFCQFSTISESSKNKKWTTIYVLKERNKFPTHYVIININVFRKRGRHEKRHGSCISTFFVGPK